MFDAANARRLMVEGQVRTADVTDCRPARSDADLAARAVPAASLAPLAYLDSDIPIANGRALLKPMVLAKLIQAARVARADRVLDVGCATGYSSAVLRGLPARWWRWRRMRIWRVRRENRLRRSVPRQVEVVIGPLTAGWPAGGAL